LIILDNLTNNNLNSYVSKPFSCVGDIDGNPYDDIIEFAESSRFVSAREYYCFKLQVRKALFNILLFGGRLFQQWAVDMYIKIETMRLDWYSKPSNQKTIRADLYQVKFIGMILLMFVNHTGNVLILVFCLIYYRVWLTPLMLERHVVIGSARESCSHEVFRVVTETCRGGSLMLWL
jgi:hypothetical protein